MAAPACSALTGAGAAITGTAAEFEDFHRDNPHVYSVLVGLARRWVQRHPGRKAGMKALYEVARWEAAFSTTGREFKLANAFTPFYARLIMLQEPGMEGLFTTLSSQADEWISTREVAGNGA